MKTELISALNNVNNELNNTKTELNSSLYSVNTAFTNKINEIVKKLNKPTFLQQIFSIKNEGNHKVLRLLGVKIKFRRKNVNKR
mgnify:CR=1 FL=1